MTQDKAIILISLNFIYLKLFSCSPQWYNAMLNGFMEVFILIWSCCVRGINCNLTGRLPEQKETLLLYYYLLKFLPVGLHFSCHMISLLPSALQIQRGNWKDKSSCVNTLWGVMLQKEGACIIQVKGERWPLQWTKAFYGVRPTLF